MIDPEYSSFPFLIGNRDISIQCIDDVLGGRATCLFDLRHHHHVDAQNCRLEREQFELLEEQVSIREIALAEFLPLCKFDFGVGVLPESPSDFFYELFIGGVDLVSIDIPA